MHSQSDLLDFPRTSKKQGCNSPSLQCQEPKIDALEEIQIDLQPQKLYETSEIPWDRIGLGMLMVSIILLVFILILLFVREKVVYIVSKVT